MTSIPEAGAYGGVATSEAGAALRAARTRISSEAEDLKRSILHGTVEMSTLGTIGAAAMFVVSIDAILSNILSLSPAKAILMVYGCGGSLALLALEFSSNPPSWLPSSLAHRLRVMKLRLKAEAHILTVLTGRALLYLFFGSLLFADAGSTLGEAVGVYLGFVGLATLYVSRSAVTKLRALVPHSTEAELRAAFDARDADRDGRLTREEFKDLVASLPGGAQLAPREVEAAMGLFDYDGDGRVDLEEFLAWYGGSTWQRNLYSPGDAAVLEQSTMV